MFSALYIISTFHLVLCGVAALLKSTGSSRHSVTLCLSGPYLCTEWEAGGGGGLKQLGTNIHLNKTELHVTLLSVVTELKVLIVLHMKCLSGDITFPRMGWFKIHWHKCSPQWYWVTHQGTITLVPLCTELWALVILLLISRWIITLLWKKRILE